MLVVTNITAIVDACRSFFFPGRSTLDAIHRGQHASEVGRSRKTKISMSRRLFPASLEKGKYAKRNNNASKQQQQQHDHDAKNSEDRP